MLNMVSGTRAWVPALLFVAFLTSASRAGAADFNPIETAVEQLLGITRLLQGGEGFIFSPVTDAEFATLAGDVTAALDRHSASAGMPLGHGRVAVSAAGERTATASAALWEAATGDRREEFTAPYLGVEAGLGSRANLGLDYTRIPANGTQVYGVHASLLAAGEAASGPALVLRLNHRRLSGVEGLDARSSGAEAIASWAVHNLRGFAGAGLVRGDISADGDLAYRDGPSLGKWFGGLQAAYGAVGLGIEIGQTGGRNYQAARLSFLFD